MEKRTLYALLAAIVIIFFFQYFFTPQQEPQAPPKGTQAPAKEAAPGTIRHDFAESKQRNIVHRSDSVEAAKKEIGLLFR